MNIISSMTFDKDIVFVIDKQDYLLVFEKPIFEVSAEQIEDVEENLKFVDDLIREGFYICGFMTYEAGYPILKLSTRSVDNRIPIIWFGAFTKPKLVEVPNNRREYSISNIHPSMTLEEYLKKVEELKFYIKNGYTYQVNFTFKLLFDFEGDVLSFFLDLRSKQKVKYARFVKYHDTYILSVSPELFFLTKGNRIISKPMKGTIRRGRFPEEDLELMKKLYTSEKNRAENLMITDLIRNDLGSISKFGSIKVKRIFEIEKYETVFQMTSTVEGILNKEVRFSEIISNIFPGGSITGAPKKKTVEIISKLETLPRGIYTGTIGYISPKGFSEFNIAIRTPLIHKNKCEMGVGSGITWYSEAEEEYSECILKSHFLTSKPYPKFKLIETFLLKNHKLYLLDYHLKRLKMSAKFFSFRYNRRIILEKLKEIVKLDGKFRLRLLLEQNGDVTLEVREFEEPRKRGYVKVSKDRVDSNDKFIYHKTTNREMYDYYTRKARDEELVDYIFLNEKGYVTEGTVNNLIIVRNGKLITPIRTSGLLRGTMLEYLSRKYKITEEFITLSDLMASERVFLCNSVSGLKEVKIIT